MDLLAKMGSLESFFIFGTFGNLSQVLMQPGSSGHTGVSKNPPVNTKKLCKLFQFHKCARSSFAIVFLPNKQLTWISALLSSLGTLSSSVHKNVTDSPTLIGPSSSVTNKPSVCVMLIMSASKQGMGAHRALVNAKRPES